jgi:hypothetical protein
MARIIELEAGLYAVETAGRFGEWVRLSARYGTAGAAEHAAKRAARGAL